MSKKVTFRFYEELNDFLPEEKKKSSFVYEFEGNPSIKDTIESIGIPHIEIDLILVNGTSVTFSYHLQDGDMVSVYPVFESMDISPVTRLRTKPLREPKFIVDIQLGKLAKYLRMLGFDTIYKNNYDETTVVTLAGEHKRIILTRNISLLKYNAVTHGYWIRSLHPVEQVTEVLHHFDLYKNTKPFSRCIVCNGIITEIPKDSIMNQLEPKTKHYYDEFYQCTSCEKVYWKGSHYENMRNVVKTMRNVRLPNS